MPVETYSLHHFLVVIHHSCISTFKCTHHQLRSLILARIFSFTIHYRACQTSHLTFAPLSNITIRVQLLIISSHLLPQLCQNHVTPHHPILLYRA